LTSANTNRKQCAGIILAAGVASRFGAPKALVDWYGKPLITKLTETMLEAGLQPVVVVVGAYSVQIRQALQEFPITLVDNDTWQLGMLSSLQTGISALPDDASGFVMALGDHPYLEKAIIDCLTDAMTNGDVVIPIYQGKRGHPVLWNCSAFSTILNLDASKTPRDVLALLKVHEVPWQNRFILEDMDTPGDYRRLLIEMRDSIE